MKSLKVAVVLAAISGSAVQACAPDRVSLRGAFGIEEFAVEVADDVDERAQGLMFRTSMARDAGMMFLYERPQALSFWMRNTLIELDMLFINSEGVVHHIHHRAQPGDETLINGGRGLAVLEINGGLAKELGIHSGTEVQHPFFGAMASWPCN